MQPPKDNRKRDEQDQYLRHQLSRVSLVALSHKSGTPVSPDLTSKFDKQQSSFITLNCHFHPEDRGKSAFAAADELCATGREICAPTPPSSVLHLNPASPNSSHYFHSSVVSPSVFHIIPELQRGQSSYHIDQSDSAPDWYTNWGDIDYLWSVVPTSESITESVKAAVWDSYTDSSLPTILQPRFKPKAPGTTLALWLPNIMASLAKRFSDETSSDLAPGGDIKSKDIVKQNLSLLLKKDFITTNWPFKGNKQGDDLPDQSHVQSTRRKVGGVTNHRTKVKHLHGADSDHKVDSDNSQPDASTMDKKLSWRGPWKKSTRINYVETNHPDNKLRDDDKHEDDIYLESYNSTPITSSRHLSHSSQEFDSERSSSAEIPLSPDSPVFLDADDSMVFFNYNDDGTSYTCTLSPIRDISQLDDMSESNMSVSTSSFPEETSSVLTPVIPASSVGSISSFDSEDEVELYEESFRLETEHINCECIKYSRDHHDDFPYLKTLEDDNGNNEEKSESPDRSHSSCSENCSLRRAGSKGKSKFKLKRVPSTHSSRQRRLTDAGKVPPNSHKEEDGELTTQDKSERDMSEKIEYMRVASLENADISARLYVRIPEKVNLCKIQTHLLLCAMRAFFTCTDGIQVRWVKSFHEKIYQLLRRTDTKIKYSCPDVMESENTVCLLLSYDASVLLRDRHSNLLTTIGDILQIRTDNLLVLNFIKNAKPSSQKKSKSKTMRLLDSENVSIYYPDNQSEWFLPIFL